MFIEPFFRSQFLHGTVKLFFILMIMNNKLRDLCGNWLLQNDFINTFCEIRLLHFLIPHTRNQNPTSETRDLKPEPWARNSGRLSPNTRDKNPNPTKKTKHDRQNLTSSSRAGDLNPTARNSKIRKCEAQNPKAEV